jgi:hypothetical protein
VVNKDAQTIKQNKTKQKKNKKKTREKKIKFVKTAV